MTATVIDASALVAYLLHEEGSEVVGEFLVEGVDSIGLVFKEAASALLAAERTGRISRDQAEVCTEALKVLMGHNIRAVEDQEALMLESYELAREHEAAIYDAFYVVLTKRLGARLLTKDLEQARLAKQEGLEVIL